MTKQAKLLEIQHRYVYNSEIEICPQCKELLEPQAYYQWRKTVQQLNGVIHIAHRASECANPECDCVGQMYPSARAQSVTLPSCTYGRDVIAQIGWWRERQHWDRQQIDQALEKQVQISAREIDYLYTRYEVLRGCLEQLKTPALYQIAKERGGLILTLDGLSPEGASEQLWVVRELQLNLTLVSAWLPKVDHLSLAALFKPVLALELPILGTISDKQPCLENALDLVLSSVPHMWCQSHYLGNAMDPIYERDLALKTELRQEIRKEIRPIVAEILTQNEDNDGCAPQLVSGALADQPQPHQADEPLPIEPVQVVRELVSDLKQALGRKGRAPFNLSGVPMFADLLSIQNTMGECLQLAEEPHLRSLYTSLSRTLPGYATPFKEVQQAQTWVKDIAAVLDTPLPSQTDPSLGADAVALQLAHCLGALADQPNLSPWLTQMRRDLFALTDRYWTGLFPCYDIPGLPRTNNDLESLFGQTKRQFRRRLGISQLREPLLRHAAWTILQIEVSSPAELHRELERVDVERYQRERKRYDQRQELFHHRHRWRHQRDAVLKQRISDWKQATLKC
jgi:hypothetical protein